MEELLKLLVEKKLSLGSVESMTGGLFASSFTSVPGASKVFKGGLVTYAVEEKVKLLGINPKIISDHGVVSEEVALEMASKGQKLLNVDICISITGNAGPTCEPGGKPVGRCYIGLAYASSVRAYELNLDGNRNEIRNEAMLHMVQLIKNNI